MEAAAAAAKADREREQRFLRVASMGLLADVEALVAEGVSVAAVVRHGAGYALRAVADVVAFRGRTRSVLGRSTWPLRATTPP
jgi:hypothetical protein